MKNYWQSLNIVAEVMDLLHQLQQTWGITEDDLQHYWEVEVQYLASLGEPEAEELRTTVAYVQALEELATAQYVI